MTMKRDSAFDRRPIHVNIGEVHAYPDNDGVIAVERRLGELGERIAVTVFFRNGQHSSM